MKKLIELLFPINTTGDKRDIIAQNTDETRRLRGTVLVVCILFSVVTIYSVWNSSRQKYPLTIPGYSDKPVYISENDAPRASMRMIAEYAAYLSQTYTPASYLQKHSYLLQYFAPGDMDKYEKFFTTEFKEIIEKDRISARYEPLEFDMSLVSNQVSMSGYLTLYKDGAETQPKRLNVTVKFSDQDKYQPRIKTINAFIEK